MRIKYLIYFLQFVSIASYSQILQHFDSTVYQKVTSPFFEMNISSFKEFGLTEYSILNYETNIKKGKSIKSDFTSGYIWTINAKKNLITEYELKNDNHITKSFRPEFVDTLYYVQDIFGKLHGISDTINLNAKIDQVNQSEKEKNIVHLFDSLGRSRRIGNTFYEYDNNNNIVRIYSTVKKYNDTISLVHTDTRYEYKNNRLSKIKSYQPIMDFYLDGLCGIEEYKYSCIGQFPRSCNIIVLSKKYEEIKGKETLKTVYKKTLGLNEKKLSISWSSNENYPPESSPNRVYIATIVRAEKHKRTIETLTRK